MKGVAALPFRSVVEANGLTRCIGGSEGSARRRGEGPCDVKTGVCRHAMTEGTTIRQGPIACPSHNFLTGEPCEYEDGICVPQGPRMVEIGTSLGQGNVAWPRMSGGCPALSIHQISQGA